MEQQIWAYGRGFYKAYVEDYKIKEKLDGYRDCKLSNRYYLPDGKLGRDYIFPAKLYNRIAGLLQLPPKEKNKNRVLAGKNSKIVKVKNGGDFAQVNSLNLG